MEILNKILSMVLGVVGVVVLINVGFTLSPELVDAVATLNVSGVVLGSVITLVAGYLPFLFLISLVIAAIVLAVKAAD